MNFFRYSFLLILLTGSLSLVAQQQLSMSDAILKAGALSPANLSQMQWIPGTTSFTHLAGKRLVRVNVTDLSTDTLDLLGPLNTALQAQEKPALEQLPAVKWLDAGKLWFQSGQDLYSFNLEGDLQRLNGVPAKAENQDIHKKTWNAAYTVGDALYVSVAGKETLVAQSEERGIVYGKSVHRDEFGIFKGTFWSPSGRYLAFYRMDERMVTEYPIYVLDSMPAVARTIRYPFAGATSHEVTLGIFDTQTGKNIFLETGAPAEQYLTNIAWSPDDRFILIAVVNRGQDHMWLNQYDARTGKFVKTLFEETSDKWVEPEHPAEFVPGSNDQFVWQSERDGYNHLYVYDLSGKLLRQISSGDMPVLNFYGFAEDGRSCTYQVADSRGMNRIVYNARLDRKTAPVAVTDQRGIHNAVVSPAGDWLIDNFSDAVTPRRIYVTPMDKPADRKIVFSALNPLADYTTGQINFTSLKADDGTPLNARLVLPPGFDPAGKYPVIVYVYNGPHVQLVANTWMGSSELWMHRMALQGYMVFVVDGRGSANRGMAFESAIHRRLGDLEIEDQLTGVAYLRSLPYIDTTRIGVFGWSYGGFMTTSLMTRPEAKGVFKCGVAGGPVLDWRMYEIMYTERYMDTPEENPDGYARSSLFNYIDNLQGRLLMIHGTSDDVVLWQHSLRYIRECVRKGKQIDYFVYPEHPHNVRGRDRVHLFEKIEQFFRENL